jgi:hypothetical protein
MHIQDFKTKKLLCTLAAIGAIIAFMAIILHLEGRLTICQCGYVKLWHGLVVSSENSQHLFDWYTFTHILHGLIWYLLLWLIDRKKRLSFTTKLLLATGIEAGWEILENSDFIINRYRSATISLDYFGDSIINSIGDVIAMIIGFVYAAKTKLWWSIIAYIILEIILLLVIRDNLTLNIIMLIHPIDAIKVWQAG